MIRIEGQLREENEDVCFVRSVQLWNDDCIFPMKTTSIIIYPFVIQMLSQHWIPGQYSTGNSKIAAIAIVNMNDICD